MRVIRELERLGYRLGQARGRITFQADAQPADPQRVAELLRELGERKAEALAYLGSRPAGPDLGGDAGNLPASTPTPNRPQPPQAEPANRQVTGPAVASTPAGDARAAYLAAIAGGDAGAVLAAAEARAADWLAAVRRWHARQQRPPVASTPEPQPALFASTPQAERGPECWQPGPIAQQQPEARAAWAEFVARHGEAHPTGTRKPGWALIEAGPADCVLLPEALLPEYLRLSAAGRLVG